MMPAARSGGATASGAVAAAARRESAQMDREQQRQLRYWDTAHRRSQDARIRDENRRHKQAMRNAEREAAAAKRSAQTQLAARRRFVEGTFGKMGQSVRSGIGAVGTFGSTAAGLAGGFAAVGAVQSVMETRRMAARLANQAGTPTLKGDLLRESGSLRGFTGQEALTGLEEFTSVTGRLDVARAIIQDMGQLALATGTELNDLMAAAGNAFIPIADKIKEPKEQMAALVDVMGAFAAQGNLGAVEIRQLATEMAGLAATTQRYSGSPTRLLKTVGAMAQAARQRGGASSAAEATTSVARFVDDIAADPSKFARAGVKVGTRDRRGKLTQLDDPEEIMVRMLAKTSGDLGEVSDLFGVYAGRAVAGFAPLFTEAERRNEALPVAERAKRGQAGERAVRAEFSRLVNASKPREEIERAAASVLEEPDMRIKEATKAFNTAVGTELLPALTQLIPEFTRMMPEITSATRALASFAAWFAENPLSGLGALVLGSVAKDLAAAGIGKAVSTILTSMLLQSRLGGAAVPVGGAAGLAGKAGAIGAAVAGVALAADQANEFGKENGGWAGAASFLGFGRGKGFGFDAVDDMMNQDARARAAQRGNGPAPPAIVDTSQLDTAAERQIQAAEAMERAAKAMPTSTGPNRTNSPSPVK
ncbi:MAG TPA: hypothetical protein VJN18_25095 [Polyangiaceae bacterium]|nr:hypothetical protein [Polyangiaceae bacterium]